MSRFHSNRQEPENDIGYRDYAKPVVYAYRPDYVKGDKR